MNLLLLLSALLSALSGFGMSAPAAQPVQVVAQQASVASRAMLAPRAVASRPLQVLPKAGEPARVPLASAVFVPSLPPWIARRRE